MDHKRFAAAMFLAGAASLAPLAAQAADAGSEITTAATHARLAAQGSDITAVHTHLHHAINCLVGPGGTGFDAKELNPCANSGDGAIPDSTSASTKQALQAALAKAESGLAATDVDAGRKDAASTEAMLEAIK